MADYSSRVNTKTNGKHKADRKEEPKVTGLEGINMHLEGKW